MHFTSCIVNFCNARGIIARVRVGRNGFPDTASGMVLALQRFLSTVESQNDPLDWHKVTPGQLAALFVSWSANHYGIIPLYKLRDIEILSDDDPRNPDYIYLVYCDRLDPQGRPTVEFTGV